MTISICMAAYNGSNYIYDQLMSILNQISNEDEIIIVDDCSSDNTVEIIEKFMDRRIVILKNDKNIGHVKSFEKAISNSVGEYVFLCDQDDIWVPNRIKIMAEALHCESHTVIATNIYTFITQVGVSGRSNIIKLPDRNSFSRNILGIFLGKMPYYGCAMCFRKQFKNILLPFPRFVEAHDLWIAIAGNIACGIVHLQSESLYHRLHKNNVTPKRKRGFLPIVKSRAGFLYLILIAYLRWKRKV